MDAQDARDPDVGSLADEATKLLGALNGWARDQGGGLSDSIAGASEHAFAAAHEVNAHLATGSSECTVCPICRTVQTARELSPEVKAHLASAAASLMHAAAAMLATVVPSHDGAVDAGMEHIDLDEELDGDPDGWPTEDPG